MDTDRIRRILEDVRGGAIPVEDAVASLRDLPYENLGFARLDHHRTLRTGFPEVVYCPGKTTEQVLSILSRLRERNAKVLATRADTELAAAIQTDFPSAVYHSEARIAVIPGTQDSGLPSSVAAP